MFGLIAQSKRSSLLNHVINKMAKFRSPSEYEARSLKDFHRRGLSTYAVRRAMKISPKILESWLMELDLTSLKVPTKRRTQPLATNEAVEFRKYYQTMPTQKEVCVVYNITIKTFESWLAQLNLEKHPRKAKPQNTRRSVDVIVRQPLYRAKSQNIRRSADAFRECRVHPEKNPFCRVVITPARTSHIDDLDDERESLAARFRRMGQVALNPYR